MGTHQESNTGQAPSKQGFIDRIFGRFRKDGAYPHWLKAVFPILSDGSVYDETLRQYFILCYVTGFACLVLNALAKWVTGNPEIGFEGPLFFAMVYAYGFFYMWIMRKGLLEAQKFERKNLNPHARGMREKEAWGFIIKDMAPRYFMLVLSMFLLQIYGAVPPIILITGVPYFLFLSFCFYYFNKMIIDGYFSYESFDPPVFKFVAFVHLIGAVYLVYKINFVWGQ